MKQALQGIKDFREKAARFFFRTRSGKGLIAAAVLAAFLSGYSLTSNVVARCAAQDWPVPFESMPGIPFSPTIITASCFSACIPPQPCDFPGEARAVRTLVAEAFELAMRGAANSLEAYIGDWLVDGLVASLLVKMNQAELNLIDWWDTFWFYNLYPALQDMTKQVHVGLADQVRTLYAGTDSKSGNEVTQLRDQRANKAYQTFAPSENAAVVGTLVGGQQRALATAAAVQKILQDDALAAGTANRGTAASGGMAAAQQEKQALYETTFCNPQANGGVNTCRGSEERNFDADTQVTKQVYNSLTINLEGAMPPGADPARTISDETLKAMLDNMVGESSAEPIPRPVLESSAGLERFLRRRSFLTRYAAVRALPQMVLGRRLPGTQMGQWVREVRQAAGLPVQEVSENPSYREVMHAMTVDRFNSGKYAATTLTDQSAIERESLIMNAMYLMQLRDLYEVMERTALVLAVQVALYAEQTPLPSPVAPIQTQ